MNARRLVSWASLGALVASCGSTNGTTNAADGGGKTSEAGTNAGDGGTGADGGAVDEGGPSIGGDAGADAALGVDDIDDDLPLSPAAGLTPTPPMGWESWNAFAGATSEQLVEQVATAMVSSGMQDAGYRYVNIDDGWAQPLRASDGGIQVSSNYPDGIKSLADYVHNLNLKFGIYSDRGTSLCSCSATCSCNNGSQDHESQDANDYAAWGVDYLKYDNCCAVAADVETQYRAMGSALAATGSPMVYSLCAWQFYEWGIGLGNLWRTTSDIQATWDSVFGNAMLTRYFAAYAGPFKYMSSNPDGGASTPPDAAYGWNDSDMMEVGNSGLTPTETQTHFSLWAITAAPLLAGNDLRTMSQATKTILTNKEVIGLNQDLLGLQGFAVRLDGSVWAKPLNESGARGVVLVNPAALDADIGFTLGEIGLRGGAASARDLVAHQDLGTFQDTYSIHLPSHGSAALKVSGVEPPRPHGTAYISDLTWTYAANGLGTAHRDEANTSSMPVTGMPITLRGRTYPKGLGVDGPSMVIYRLARQCTSFSADIGVDDAAAGAGSVVFEVWADGEKLFGSNTITGMSPVQSVQVDLTAKRRLILLVTNAGDGNAQDRADWAKAQVVCAP